MASSNPVTPTTDTAMPAAVRAPLQQGVAIPAHPLALTAARKLDERRQRALSRYYLASGVGGLAVGVHTTQFAIRKPEIGLFEPVLTLAGEEMDRADAQRATPVVRVAGVCGPTKQAVAEAELARWLGYHAGLAAMLAGKLPELAGRTVVLLLSGGNIDPLVLQRMVEQGLTADGRPRR